MFFVRHGNVGAQNIVSPQRFDTGRKLVQRRVPALVGCGDAQRVECGLLHGGRDRMLDGVANDSQPQSRSFAHRSGPCKGIAAWSGLADFSRDECDIQLLLAQ
jgi:hypothetical protein